MPPWGPRAGIGSTCRMRGCRAPRLRPRLLPLLPLTCALHVGRGSGLGSRLPQAAGCRREAAGFDRQGVAGAWQARADQEHIPEQHRTLQGTGSCGRPGCRLSPSSSGPGTGRSDPPAEDMSPEPGQQAPGLGAPGKLRPPCPHLIPALVPTAAPPPLGARFRPRRGCVRRGLWGRGLQSWPGPPGPGQGPGEPPPTPAVGPEAGHAVTQLPGRPPEAERRVGPAVPQSCGGTWTAPRGMDGAPRFFLLPPPGT